MHRLIISSKRDKKQREHNSCLCRNLNGVGHLILLTHSETANSVFVLRITVQMQLPNRALMLKICDNSLHSEREYYWNGTIFRESRVAFYLAKGRENVWSFSSIDVLCKRRQYLSVNKNTTTTTYAHFNNSSKSCSRVSIIGKICKPQTESNRLDVVMVSSSSSSRETTASI